jgi:dehydrogenase/reductase SDR family protein 1
MSAAPTVAVVTGAARGIGRGVALVLGERGATVYATDRDTRERRHAALPGTAEDTAEQVTARGGRGIPVAVDHSDDDAVADLFARIEYEQDGLDLLVANAFAGNALPFRSAPFWKLPIGHWHNMFDNGVRGHLVAASYAAQLLIRRRGLLIFTGYADNGDGVTAGHLYYDLAMAATRRLARSVAYELQPHAVTALCVSPGFTRTEAILAELGEVPPGTDSVEFTGRVIGALLDDPDVRRHSGLTLTVATLASEYGVTDVADSDTP